MYKTKFLRTYTVLLSFCAIQSSALAGGQLCFPTWEEMTSRLAIAKPVPEQGYPGLVRRTLQYDSGGYSWVLVGQSQEGDGVKPYSIATWAVEKRKVFRAEFGAWVNARYRSSLWNAWMNVSTFKSLTPGQQVEFNEKTQCYETVNPN